MSTEPTSERQAFPSALFTRCRRCGRGLSSPKAMQLGYGAVCARKMGVSLAASPTNRERPTMNPPNAMPMQTDVRVWRDLAGTVHANVPWSVVWHSPDGFECGYGGSGPADLALNILNAFVPPGRTIDWSKEGDWERDDRPEECHNGCASLFAARHHQDFKRDFIAGMDRNGGTISAAQIQAWIESKRKEFA